MAEIEADELLTLDEACEIIFRGKIKPSTLRAERDRGTLVVERIGRRDFVTRQAIREMRERCRAVPQKDPAFGSSQKTSAAMAASSQPSGSFATDRLSVARDSLELTLQQLSKPSAATSPKSTNRAKSARVIQIKS